MPESTRKDMSGISAEELDRLAGGAHHNPHSLLGSHSVAGGTAIRTLRPGAREVTLLLGEQRMPMDRVHDVGIFSVHVPSEVGDYRLEVAYDQGSVTVDDGYRYLPTLGEVDLHLIGEGRHERLWEVLGAHVRTYESLAGPVAGVSFAVWAPNAQGVRVTGDFDWWTGTGNPMRSMGSSGVWEVFIPGLSAGSTYKYRILGRDGVWRDKIDPVGSYMEVPPATASIVWESGYEWSDSDWLSQRAQRQWHAEPMSVYEVHLGSWREGLSYRDMADQLVSYVKDLGYTHVEFMPVAEHPFAGSWGYQVSGYYAPTSRFGNPDDFKFLVDRFHQEGIGVIVDWVPAHFPKDEWALGRFDGTPLYEAADPRRGEHPDWGTFVFDFGRSEVRNFLVANANYWLEEYHIDGLRVDAVASMLYLDYSREAGEWLPNIYGGRENLDAVAFLQETNATVYKTHPGVVMIAEESTAWPGVTRPTHVGGLGFGFKWNMGWMHDSLTYVSKDPIYRQYHHHQMTFSMMYAYSENFVLPISHDEVVHGKGSLVGKMPGDRWKQLANLRAFLAYMWAHPGKQLLFMGSEFAQSAEWNSEASLDWWLLDFDEHKGVQRLVTELNRVYKESPALFTRDIESEGFAWIDANDVQNNTFSFLRWGSDGSAVACVTNFAGEPHDHYRLGLPFAGTWQEVLNTDAVEFGGSGVGNMGSVEAIEESWHWQPASTTMRVPPLGSVWLRHPGRG